MTTPSDYRPILRNHCGFSVQRGCNGVWLNTLSYVIADMISDGRIIITRPIKRYEVSSDGNSRRLINYTRGLHREINAGVSV